MEINNKNMKTLNKLRDAIVDSNVIYIAISFITKSGIDMLFKDIDTWNKKILVVTTNDENITDQKAIDRLLELGADVRVINKELNDVEFHGKFIATEGNINFALAGSFNLTGNSFTGKIETIVKADFEDTKETFIELWEMAHDHTMAKFNNNIHEDIKLMDEVVVESNLVPNDMQSKTLDEIDSLIRDGERRFLLWAATATGKTITSLLLREKLNRPKTLFIVNQNKILESAHEDYSKHRPNWINRIYNKQTNLDEVDVLFITSQTAKKLIDKNPDVFYNFQLLVVDETHHLGPNSEYEVIFDSFDREEKIIFGMTATPRRTKEPLHVILKYGGEKNVVGRITADVALEKELIVPMKYYDISSESEDDVEKDISSVVEVLNKLETSDGGKLKAIIFTNNIPNSKLVSNRLNELGINSIPVTSSDNKYSLHKLNEMISNEEHELNALVTVDMFNEGVDLPSVNTIVMLRKTESKIVYTQQIGRVLRKSKNKKYANVIDVVNNKDVEFEKYISLFGLDGVEDPLDALKKLVEALNKNVDENGRVKIETEFGNEFNLNKIDEDTIIKLISKSKMKTKLIDYYKEHLLEKSLTDGELRLSNIEEIMDEKVQLISNTFRLGGGSFKFENDLPWIVELFKEYHEIKNIRHHDKLTTKDKIVIELLSWLPITTSTIEDKSNILDLINGSEVKMTHKWLSYFGGYYNNGSDLISVKLFNPEYYELVKDVFIVDFDNSTIKFKYNSSSSYDFYLNEIVNYLQTNNRDDLFKVNTWYSTYEMGFMLGYLVVLQTGDFKTFKLEYESSGQELEMAIKASVKSKKTDKNFDNYIKDDETIVFSRANKSNHYDKDDIVHLFLNSDGGVSKKYFTNKNLLLYVGSADLKSGKLRPTDKKDKPYYYEFNTEYKIDYREQALLKY